MHRCLVLRGEQLAISMQQRHLNVARNLNGENESCGKYDVFSEPWEKGANMHVSQAHRRQIKPSNHFMPESD